MKIPDPLSTEIVAVLAALVIPALLVEPARRLALRHGLVERPARHRVFTQKRFVPRLGGVVVAAAALAPAVTVTGRLDVRLTTLLAGAATVSLLGLLRDLRRIRLPIGAATHATMAFAVAVGDVRLRLIEPSWLDLVITMLWVVGIANAFRVLDSTDGVLPTVTCATAVPLAASAFVIDQTELALLLLCLAAACAGFLLHNAPPARITMGDSGALCAGFFLAVSAAIVHSGHGSFVGLPILMLITSVVAVDAVVVAVAGRDRGWVEDGPGRPTRLGFALGPNLLLVLLVLSTAGGGLLAVLVAGGVLPAAGTVAGALLVGTTLIVLLLQKPAPAPPPQLPRIAERHVVAPARTLVKEGAQR